MNEGYSLQPFLTYYTQQMVFFMITIIIITFHHDPAWDKCGGKWMDGLLSLFCVYLPVVQVDVCSSALCL